MNNLAGQHVLVLGLGASGLALARWCARHGSSVTVADTRTAPPQLARLQQELPTVRFIPGDFAALLERVGPVDLVLRSPGLAPADIAVVLDATRAQGVPCGNELSLFAQALRELAEVSVMLAEASVAAAEHVEGALPVDAMLADGIATDLDTDIDIDTGAENAVTPAAQSAETKVETDEAATEPVVLTGEQAADDLGTPDTAALDIELDSELDPALDLELDGEPALALPLAAPEVAEAAAYRPKVIAITGTNGKTTVTSLTGQLLARAGKRVAVAGNIGPTLLDTLSACLDSDTLPEVWVLELSSFQLDEVTGFEPTVATVLNLSQDHLDWHGSMAAYARAKSAIYGRSGIMLINRDDPQLMAAQPAPVKVAFKGKQLRQVQTFGLDAPQRPGDYGIETVNGMAWLVRAAEADETVKRRRDEEIPLYVQRLMPVDALRIRGRHNATNALAALGLAAAAGCTLAPLLHGLRDYRGEPHRLESVAVVRDVEYFDDSKGTNVGATVAALNGLGPERRLLLILGGEGKGQDFAPLAEPVARFVRAVVLIGRDAPLIRAALADTGVELLEADSMADAVNLAAHRAQAGDAVLMSPACASFDMFDNYAHRAQVFCEAVQALALDAGVSA